MAKNIQDQSGVKNRELINALKKTGKRSGIAQKPIDEGIPVLEKAVTEKIISGDNNAFVLLGRDRPSTLKSGFGGKGATQAGRIDLIAGLAAGLGPSINEDTVVSPNFALDASRIYISQKADIDKYMGLADTPRQSKPGASAIGMKADAIRIHARNDIKIVTGRARFEGSGKDGEKLSSGGINQGVGSISLIAGNYTEDEVAGGLNFFNSLKKSSSTKSKLQPIPKGDNLAECLQDIIDTMGELASQIGTNTSLINQMNSALIAHVHTAGPIPTTPSPVYAPVGAVVTTQAISAIASRTALTSKLETLKLNHLNKFVGKNYINSKYVFTT